MKIVSKAKRFNYLGKDKKNLFHISKLFLKNKYLFVTIFGYGFQILLSRGKK